MRSSTFSLRFKFISGLVFFALALGICISIIMYFYFNSIMQSEVSQRSRMLLAQSNAIQEYVKTVLRPEMYELLPEGRFVLKAMSSSYISRQVMSLLEGDETFSNYYRRVARKPRNPDSSPTPFELSLISRFNWERTLEIWEEETLVEGVAYHLVARPVTFTESCMKCHGEPGDAPRELLEIYGSENGFHYELNEVGGVVVAGFPVDMIKDPVKLLTLQYLVLYFLGILCFAALISLFFDKLVMKNLHHLTSIFKIRFSGEQEQGIIHKLEEKGEIEGLIEGVEELAICLSRTRDELEDHTHNLEQMVEERTGELNSKAEKYHRDVKLFVELLSGFGTALDMEGLILGVLESVGQRFKADQVVYHCTVVSERNYQWKPQKKIYQLTPEVRQILWKEDVFLCNNCVYIPIKSQESLWGILCIIFSEGAEFKGLDDAMLLALGQQTAILIENIQAFSNIRFQNERLQSIFEGISDPLLLIDTTGHILMANKGSETIFQNKNKAARDGGLKAFLTRRDGDQETFYLVDRVVETNHSVSEEIKTWDGRFFRIDLYPLAQRSPGVLQMVLYAREITMEKKMVTRMQQAERLSGIGKMAAGIAHEINNPLGVIQCYTDLVKDAVDDSQVNQDIDVILKHTRNAKKVVQDLLNISRSKRAISGRCDINGVVTQALKVFKTQGGSRNIIATANLGNELPEIKCDVVIVEQILTNLWLNAFDALHESGGEVVFNTAYTEMTDEILLSVEDNAGGIPEEILAQMFDPFYTTKAVGKGTGLGLSVVYGFVSELGGRIEVKSDDTTCFKIYFPVDT